VIVLAAIGLTMLLGKGYEQGRFDHALYNVGLNYTECAQNGFGSVFCGDELERYKARISN